MKQEYIQEQLVVKSFGFDLIHDNEMRKFKCWGSVEVLDRHNETIPAAEVYKVMDIWMDRGAPIMFNHTNRQIGKGLNWQKSTKDGKPGVLITGMIYKHYKEDDEVWEGIKKGNYEGLSIGGKSYTRDIDSDGNAILRNLIGYEFSVVERCGNQDATWESVNNMAKSEQEMKKEDEPVMDDTSGSEQEDRVTQLENAVAALAEKLSIIEEKISGAPDQEEEAAVEEEKAEDEEAVTPEEPEKPEDEMAKKESDKDEMIKKLSDEVSDLKKSVDTLKSQIVVKTIAAPRPEAKDPKSEIKKETKEEKLMKSVNQMAEKGNIDFVKLGREMRSE